jgi:ribonucleotide reductase beta subunit family protein with ferritin-like domain
MIKKHKSLFQPRAYYKPFEYPEAYSFYETHEAMHWAVKEVPMHQDVLDWKNKLSESEKHFLTQIFRLFTQSDVDVAGAYANKYIPMFPKPEVRMMLLSFAAREAVHIQAYSHLIDTIGMPESTYKAFMEYEAMREKHNFIEDFMGTDEKQIAQQIAAFSAFTEGMQLFSSFVLLLNFSRFNLMNGMGQIIAWSIKDESCLSGDTEVLTTSGWKNIKDVSMSDKVLQYDIKDGQTSFVNPSRIVSSTKNVSYIFENDNFHQHVTGDHRMVTSGGFITAENTTGGESYVVSGVKNDGYNELSEVDKIAIEMIANGDDLMVDSQWIYDKIPYVSSKWAESAVSYWLSHPSVNVQLEAVEAFKTLANIAGGVIENNQFVRLGTTGVTKTVIQHEPTNFYCLTVPSSAFVIRSNGKISVTGNCHVDGMTWLFKEFIKENRHIWNDDLKKQLYTIAEKMVELEDKFIDLAYTLVEDNDTSVVFKNLKKEEVKRYIRYITDRRLIGLGMKGIFKIKQNPLPWVEEIINAPEHANFFEQRATAYSKGSLTGDWGSVWV